MIIGFTGTQNGMTMLQLAALRRLLVSLGQGNEFHHGDCIGADAEAHEVAESLGMFIVVHPPENSVKRAYKKGNIVRNSLPYLARNREIVLVSEFIIGCPKEATEQLRSGTWSTLRCALRERKPYAVIKPSGEIEEHEIR